MKRTISVITTGALALGAYALPLTSALAATPNWTLNPGSTITFVCGGGNYVHTLDTVTQDGNGTLTGTGHYNPDAGYTWDLTGSISGDDITYTITYTGIAAGSVYTNTGTIAGDGSISGSSSSNCQTFTMPAGSATAIPTEVVATSKEQCKKGGWEDLVDDEGNSFKNQGDCVSFVATGGKNKASIN